MECQFCKSSNANVHLTRIIEGEVQKASLCEACAREHGLQDPLSYSLLEPLLNLSSQRKRQSARASTERKCPACGMKETNFRSTGRMGCSKCYQVFEDALKVVLKGMHKGTSHIGKIPGRLHPNNQTQETEGADRTWQDLPQRSQETGERTKGNPVSAEEISHTPFLPQMGSPAPAEPMAQPTSMATPPPTPAEEPPAPPSQAQATPPEYLLQPPQAPVEETAETIAQPAPQPPIPPQQPPVQPATGPKYIAVQGAGTFTSSYVPKGNSKAMPQAPKPSLLDLQKQMQAAINDERYEEAAKLRDQLRQITEAREAPAKPAAVAPAATAPNEATEE